MLFVRSPFAISMQPPSRILFLLRTRCASVVLVANIAPRAAAPSSLIWQSVRSSFFRVVLPASASHTFAVHSLALMANIDEPPKSASAIEPAAIDSTSFEGCSFFLKPPPPPPPESPPPPNMPMRSDMDILPANAGQHTSSPQPRKLLSEGAGESVAAEACPYS